MDFTLFFQQVVDGLASGAIYGSLALALVMIYRSTGIINFAQGEMAMFSTYIAWQLTEWGVGILLALFVTVLLSFVAGAAIQATVIRPVEGADHLTQIMVTLGIFFIINNIAGWQWTYQGQVVPSVFGDRVLSLDDVRVTALALGTVLVLIAEVALLTLLLQRSRVGLAMRGAVDNPESAELCGVSVTRMLMIGWGLAAAFGAIAGVLVTPRLFLSPSVMFGVLIYSFAAAILGGLDSPIGAVVGGLTVGVAENLASTYIDFVGGDLKIGVALALIIVVLLVRPNGLFGSAEVARV
ncbi:branched-chain amino acid ABC transporter permease [Candidatus Poriferisocius sp.]|uniref:branched-chain amino acid ABC transporter permease n=1 Tax=Candidatus Poriferisocius sp. TaxID=3101276 RepID=UPI003B5BBF81